MDKKSLGIIAGLVGVIAVLLIGAQLLGIGGVGSKKEEAMMEGGDTMPKAGVEIKDFKYSPATLTVKAGEKITVTNKDVAGHSVTSDDGKSFDSGVLSQDQSIVITAPAVAGTYPFHCTPHPSIKGTLVVE